MRLKPKCCRSDEGDDEDDDDDDDDSELTSETKSESRPLTSYESQLEDEVETLHNALFSLSSHFAKVQFRLRQITNASTCERQRLLRELELVSCEGLDGKHAQDELPSLLCDAHSMGDVRAKQRSIIKELRNQLEDLTVSSRMCFATEEGGCFSLCPRRLYCRNSDGYIDYAYEDKELDEGEKSFEPKHGTSCMCCRCRGQSTTAYSGCPCEDDMVARELREQDDFLYQREPKVDKRKFIRERGYLPQSWNIDKSPQEETFTCKSADNTDTTNKSQSKKGDGKRGTRGKGKNKRSKNKSKKLTQSLDRCQKKTALQRKSDMIEKVISNGQQKRGSKYPCRCIKCWGLAGDKKAASSPDLRRFCNSKQTCGRQKSMSVRKSVKSFKDVDNKKQVKQIKNKQIQNRHQAEQIDRKRESKGSTESSDRDGSENLTMPRNPIGIEKSAWYYNKDPKKTGKDGQKDDKKIRTSSDDTSKRDSESTYGSSISSHGSDRSKRSSSRSVDAERVDKPQQSMNVKKQKCVCCYCKRRFVEDFKKTFEKDECPCPIVKKVQDPQKEKKPGDQDNVEKVNKDKLKKQKDNKKLVDAKNKKLEKEKKKKIKEDKKKLEQEKKRKLEEEKKKFEEEKKRKLEEEKKKFEEEIKRKLEEEKKKFEKEKKRKMEEEKKFKEEKKKKMEEEEKLEEETKKKMEEENKLRKSQEKPIKKDKVKPPNDTQPIVSSLCGIVKHFTLVPQANDLQNRILKLCEVEKEPKASNEVNNIKPILKTSDKSDVSKQSICKSRKVPLASTSTLCRVLNCSKCGQLKKKKICFESDCKYKTQR